LKHPKYTHAFLDAETGKPRFYLRMPGRKRVPLPGLPWSPEFMAAREAAMKGEWIAPEIGASRTKAGTVNAAIVSYYQSTAFTSLAIGTRQMRRAILERFRNEHGDKPIALMHRKAVATILNKMTPAVARNWRKSLRGLIDHCLALELISVDPLAGVKLPKLISKPHRPWTWEDVAKFEQRHPRGTRARLALELLLSTGQAKCDVIRMGRQFVRDGVLSMARQKTGVAFDLPVLRSLQDELALQTERHLTFLVTEQGRPFTAGSFGNWFRERCIEAGVPARAHGLRSLAAIRLCESGATDFQLMSWMGWRSISEAQRYTKDANRKRLAVEAAKLISGTEIGKSENQFAKNDRK
jgi:integrase